MEDYKGQGVTLCGDVLLISAFVSYVGYFTKKYRNELMEKFWVPYINKLTVSGLSLGEHGRSPRGRDCGLLWPMLTPIRAVGVAVSLQVACHPPPVTSGR